MVEDKAPLIQLPGQDQMQYNDKYVLVYDFKDIDSSTAIKEFTELLTGLETAGLHTEVRAGYEKTLLVFVKASKEVLGDAVHKSRVKDWLYGIVQTHPGGTKNTAARGAFEAEDLLSVYHLVIQQKSMGGAGVTPGWGKWERVTSCFPLHNTAENQKLLKRLSRRLLLKTEDLDQIRDLFGSKVAFYFAFIQTYLVFLIFPAITGVITWYLQSRYSLTYAILTCVWCTVMLEYWKIQEIDLSIRWDVRNVTGVKPDRPQFRWEKVYFDDTGREMHYFPRWKQAARQLLQIPFVLLSALTLGAIIVGVFALEILISEGYTGSYKAYAEYIPTIMLALALPRLNGLLENVAKAITEFENHRLADSYEMSLTQKNFILSIITNYLPIFITAFVYVPFGENIIPWISDKCRNFLGSYGSKFLTDSHSGVVDSSRLRDEVIALALTGQVSSFFEENILPVAKRKLSNWYRDFRAARSTKRGGTFVMEDPSDEAKFLRKARNEATLEVYNVQDDIAEIVLQFGYLALFSPVWPLISIGFLINNIIEIRTDFIKITNEFQRPDPIRADGIGPWITSLDFLTWAGSLSTGAIVHLFGANSIAGGAWWALPITIFISEHVFTGLRSLVRGILHRIGSEQIRKERNERYALRSKYLKELDASRQLGASLTVAERDRRKSIRALGGESFFTKQMEEGSSALFGIELINSINMTRDDNTKLHAE